MSSVPYVSQVGQGVRNACGPACALMLARHRGVGLRDSVAYWSRRIDPDQDGTSANDLARMFRELGLAPVVATDVPYPYIAIVHYPNLPHRYDPNYRQYHWIVRLDDDTYHDPYWPDSRGANLKAPRGLLDKIVGSVKVGVRGQAPVPTPDVPSNWRATQHGARVRTTPDIAPVDNIIALIPANATFTGTLTSDQKWIRVSVVSESLRVGNVKLVPSAVSSAFTGYVSTNVAIPAPPTPPPPPPPTPPAPPPSPPPAPPTVGQVAIGLHVLNPSVDHSGETALRAFERGCRHFVVIDDELFALRLANMGATVVFRWYVSWRATPAEFVGRFNALRVNSSGQQDPNGTIHPNIIVVGHNEGEQYGCWDAVSLRERFWFEKDLASRVRAMGGRYAAVSFAPGNPDILDEECKRVLRELYAPAYNRGEFMVDYHAYSPNMNFLEERDWPWHGRRWEFFFTQCGFDPKVRGIIATETGVDTPGVGGFAAHNARDEDIVAWCRKFIEVQSRPVSGQPSPFLFGCIFQASRSSRWAGYDVSGRPIVWRV